MFLERWLGILAGMEQTYCQTFGDAVAISLYKFIFYVDNEKTMSLADGHPLPAAASPKENRDT